MYDTKDKTKPCSDGKCGLCWVCGVNKESERAVEEHKQNGPCGEESCSVCPSYNVIKSEGG